MRLPIVAANWKMNNTTKEGILLIEELIPLVKNVKCEVVVCPPATSLQAISQAIKGTNIKLGAQNVHFAEKGAYTGEISADMLLEFGVEYVIIGHSERRECCGDTDETVNKRAVYALERGLSVIVCMGETRDERNSGFTKEILAKQVSIGLNGITDFSRVVIAYEPNWAIGTGQAASLKQVTEAIIFIRQTISAIFGNRNSQLVRIQYGGSLEPANAQTLFATEDIDGGLIGSAALSAITFSDIINEVK